MEDREEELYLDGEAMDPDVEIRKFIKEAKKAYKDDLDLYKQLLASMNKYKLLPKLLRILRNKELVEYFIDNEGLSVLKLWLEPLPNGDLSSVTLRQSILEALLDVYIEKNKLKESELGKVVMYSYKCEKETKHNKKIAGKLIDMWSREITGNAIDYRELARNYMPSDLHHGKTDHKTEKKRRKQNMEETDS